MLSALFIMPIILALSVVTVGLLRPFGVRLTFERVLTAVGIGVVFLPIAAYSVAMICGAAIAIALVAKGLLPNLLPFWAWVGLGAALGLGMIAFDDARKRIKAPDWRSLFAIEADFTACRR